jgi:uncharacterized protein (DUF4415 family)
MGREHIVKLASKPSDGTAIVEHADGRLEKREDKTNWQHVDALTEEDLETAIRTDGDWEGLVDIDWSQIEVIRPARKTAISIRVDEDVLSFFKRGGEGYQKRINAVLRSYVTASNAASSGKDQTKQRNRS